MPTTSANYGLIFCVIIFLGCSAHDVGAMCTWTDNNGTMHYTDNVGSAPRGTRCEDEMDRSETTPSNLVQNKKDERHAEYRELAVLDDIRYSFDIRNMNDASYLNQRGKRQNILSIPVRSEKVRTGAHQEWNVKLDCVRRPGVSSPPNSPQLPYQAAAKLHYYICVADEF